MDLGLGSLEFRQPILVTIPSASEVSTLSNGIMAPEKTYDEADKGAIWCARFLIEPAFRKDDTPLLRRADNPGTIALN